MDRYYIPIDSTTLAHYFNCGLILPSKYINNKPNDSIQDIDDNYIFSSKKRWVNSVDCSLEIALSESQKNDFNGDTFFFEEPIPISRVKKIYFKDENIRIKTISNITQATAYIPDGLIEIDGSVSPTLMGNYDKNILGTPKQEYYLNIKLFYQRLGSLSCVHFDNNQEECTSSIYIELLKQYTGFVGDEVSISNKREKVIERYKEIFVDKNSIQDIAKKEKIKIESDELTGNLNLEFDDKNSGLYESAVLCNYCEESSRKSVKDLIEDLQSGKLVKNYGAILYMLGLHIGYEKLNNSYSSGKNNFIAKFKLDSELDYYAIEGIYQITFFNKKNKTYPYLDEWIPVKPFQKIDVTNQFRVLDNYFLKEENSSLTVKLFLELCTYFSKKIFDIFSMDKKKYLEEENNKIEKEIQDKINTKIGPYEQEISYLHKHINERDGELLSNGRLELATKTEELDKKTLELEGSQKVIIEKDELLSSGKTELARKTEELDKKILELEGSQKVIIEKDELLSSGKLELARKTEELDKKILELEGSQKEITEKDELLSSGKTELARKTEELDKKILELEGSQKVITEKNEQLKVYESELAAKNVEHEKNHETSNKEGSKAVVSESLMDDALNEFAVINKPLLGEKELKKFKKPELIDWAVKNGFSIESTMTCKGIINIILGE